MTDSNTITFTVKTKKLIDSINTCYLNSGTIMDPIQVDDFVTIDLPIGSNLPGFEYSQKIGIELSVLPIVHGATIKHSFICLKLQNIGIDFSKLVDNPEKVKVKLGSWHEIFNLDKNTNTKITQAPDGALYFAPINCHEFPIFLNPLKDGSETYEYIFSYSILFSIDYNKRKYYCKIDPTLKVSSNPPR